MDCASLKDPAFQLALLLHNPQNSNEIFLLSLRDCLATLPAHHPLRGYYQRKAAVKPDPVFAPIIESLQNELRGVWTSEKELSEKQRSSLMRLLDVMDEYPPYLDFVILQAVGYQRLGNWARSESQLKRWLSLSPLERLEKTSSRRDAFGQYFRENMESYLEALVENGKERFVIQIFLLAMKDTLSDSLVVEKVEKFLDVDGEEVLTKLALHYHRAQVPGFSDWYLNRHLEGKRRERFLDQFFENQEGAKSQYWIFLGRMPELPRHREALAKLLLGARKDHQAIFYVMAQDDSIRPVLQRLEPTSVKNLLKERRQFFMSAYASNRSDMLALTELVRLGQIDETLVREIAGQ